MLYGLYLILNPAVIFFFFFSELPGHTLRNGIFPAGSVNKDVQSRAIAATAAGERMSPEGAQKAKNTRRQPRPVVRNSGREEQPRPVARHSGRENWSAAPDDRVKSESGSLALFETPWTVAHQAPLSMEFSRQESCSGYHSLPQGIFRT